MSIISEGSYGESCLFQKLSTATRIDMHSNYFFRILKANFLLFVTLLDSYRNKYTPSLSPMLTEIDWMIADDILFRYTFETRDTDSPPSKQKNTRQ